jgi:undecaprenyl-diphosphatase
MTFLQAIVLGILQGATEFLPISSSGHLVVVPALFGWSFDPQEAFIFDVWVQLGTLLAVIAYFWPDLWRITLASITSLWRPNQWALPETRQGLYLVIATLPAVVIGLLFKDTIEALFSAPRAAAAFLLLTALLLVLAERAGRRTRTLNELNWRDALWIGLFQALALLPGVSRSGSTITGGMLRHLDRPAAARFSFLMSVPVMLGAGVFTGADLLFSPGVNALLPQIVAGMAAAALVGFISIHWLLRFVSSRPVWWFSFYLVALAALVLVIL